MEYGLIGEKLGHSFSKTIHERLASYEYNLIELNPDEIERFFIKRNFKGINVTIPYKSLVIPFLDSIDESAKKIGAVNTIVNDKNKLRGYNTDYYGFLYTLEHNKIDVKNKKVIILGNGGASKAVIAVLDHLQAGEIIIVGRTLRDKTISFEECYDKHLDGEIIINTTPVGMYPATEASPINLEKFNSCSHVVDLIYNPLQTKFLDQANTLGIKGVNGLEMLIAQAKVAAQYFLDSYIKDDKIEAIYKELQKELK